MLLLEGYLEGFTSAQLHKELFQLFSKLFLIDNLFLLVGSATYEVSTSNLRVMGMVTSDRFLHLKYFSLVFGSLKPFNSILTNTKSFQCCLMFYTTSKIDWSLNNLENWDNPIVLGICCMPSICLITKADA